MGGVGTCEADGRRSGNWETDTTTGRNGKGTILTLTERLADFILMEKSGHGRETAHAAETAIRLSLLYRENGVKTLTTDNGGGFSAHGKIMETMKETAVRFVPPAFRGRKAPIENANKLIRQYVPESTDFSNPGNSFLKKYRPR